MTTVTPLRRDDGPLVLPAAIVAGATMHTDDAKHATPVHNASTGETIGWQEHASATQIDAAVRAAHGALGAWRATGPYHTRQALTGSVLRSSNSGQPTSTTGQTRKSSCRA